MAVSQSDPVSELVALVTLAFRNWILAVPNFVVAILTLAPILIFGGAGLLSMLFTGSLTIDPLSAATAMVPSLVAGLVIACIVAIVLGIIAHGTLYAGAGDALRGQAIDLGELLRRGMSYFGTIFVCFLIIFAAFFVAEIVVILLSAVTMGLLGFILVPLLVCASILASYYLMYSLPAIVLGNRTALDAIKESFNLSYRNAGRSLTAVAGLIVAWIGALVASLILHFIPVIGAIAGLAIYGLFLVYTAIVLSKFYLELSGKGAAQSMPPRVAG